MSSLRMPLLLCGIAAVLAAQDFRASLSGVVSDPTGAAIPGASIRVLQAGMTVPLVSKTNQDGYYTFPFLNPGQYTVEASAAGFQMMRETDLVLLTSEKRELPFHLALSGANTSVDVS